MTSTSWAGWTCPQCGTINSYRVNVCGCCMRDNMTESVKTSFSWTCGHCGSVNYTNEYGTCGSCGKLPRARPPVHGPLYQFDEAIQKVTTDRGKIYGHPADDFAQVVQTVAGLPSYDDPRFQHIAYMIAVKLARLANTPDHIDSIIDIAGYARCWAMILDREKQDK